MECWYRKILTSQRSCIARMGMHYRPRIRTTAVNFGMHFPLTARQTSSFKTLGIQTHLHDIVRLKRFIRDARRGNKKLRPPLVRAETLPDLFTLMPLRFISLAVSITAMRSARRFSNACSSEPSISNLILKTSSEIRWRKDSAFGNDAAHETIMRHIKCRINCRLIRGRKLHRCIVPRLVNTANSEHLGCRAIFNWNFTLTVIELPVNG